jgi:chemotaxis protein MotB
MTKVELKITKGAPAWVVTFGDLMSLLLTFFVLLLSFSKVTDTQRYQQVNGAMKNSFGLAQKKSLSAPSAMDLIRINDDFTMTATKLEEELRKEVLPRYPADEKKIEKPEIVRRKDRIILRFDGEAMFPSGKQEIDPRFHAFLDGVAAKAKGNNANTIIEAHTDNMPFRNNVFSSNSDLSMARAAQVAAYLTSVQRIVPSRVLAVGKGPHEPLYRNNTRKGRAKNRRIEIQFVKNKVEKGSLRLGTDKAPRFEVGGSTGRKK